MSTKKNFLRKWWDALVTKWKENQAKHKYYSEEYGSFLGKPIFNPKFHINSGNATLFDYANTAFFAIFSYFIIQIFVFYFVTGEWRFFQAEEKHPVTVFFMMMGAAIMGHYWQVFINYTLWPSHFWHKKFWLWYLFLTVLFMLVINEYEPLGIQF